jgi:hypothetical protein
VTYTRLLYCTAPISDPITCGSREEKSFISRAREGRACCEDLSLGRNMSHISRRSLVHNPAALIAALQAHSHGSITVRGSSLHRIKASGISHAKSLLPYLVAPLATYKRKRRVKTIVCITSISLAPELQREKLATPSQDAFAVGLFTYCTVLLFYVERHIANIGPNFARC